MFVVDNKGFPSLSIDTILTNFRIPYTARARRLRDCTPFVFTYDLLLSDDARGSTYRVYRVSNDWTIETTPRIRR